jgi:hypothetical protein
MNSKIVAILTIILVLVGLKFFYKPDADQTALTQTAPTQQTSVTGQNVPTNPNANLVNKSGDDVFVPATQKYASAAEALDAARKAAVDYDDALMISFNNLKNCSWCEEFYAGIEKMAGDPAISLDQRAYFAEVLAGSGDVNILKKLVGLYETATVTEDKEMFGEALEMAEGGDDIVQYLSGYLTNSDATLRESVVSAISNQGSRLAVETLYKDMISGGGANTDYYSLGTGLAETVPDETAIPYLHELLIQRAPKSEYVVKALLNGGMEGITVVFDALSSEKDEARGKELLRDALDHIITDDEVTNFLTKASATETYPNFLREFAKEALAEAQSEDLEDDEDF